MSNTPLYPGYAVGWKGWTHLAPPGLLVSAATHVWLPGEPARAMCARGHEAPQYDCQCGFYATKEPDEQWATYSVVYGKVALWGRVIEHERGYRAQYAYPLELWVYPDYQCVKLRDYGVPTHEERPPWYIPPPPVGPEAGWTDELRAKAEEMERRRREYRQRRRQRLRELRNLAYEAGYIKPPRRWKGQLCLDFIYDQRG